MKLFTTVLVICLAAATQASDKCRGGWTLVGNQCVKHFANKVQFDQALFNCYKMGAYMPSIHNEEDLRRMYQMSRILTWVGGKAEKGGKVFQWLDGTPFDYAKWQPGQPDLTNENCLSIGWFNNENYDNTWCTYKATYLCAHKPGELSKPENNCEDGWWKIGKKCVKYFKDWVNQDTAIVRCQEHGGVLPSVHSLLENSLLWGMAGTAGITWIGGLADGGGKVFHWMDGSDFDYSHWKPGQPDIASENCLTLGYWKTAEWDNYWCNYKGNYFCANNGKGSKAPGGCRKGYTRVGDTCAKFFPNKVSFYTAMVRCAQMGAEMPSIHTDLQARMMYGLSNTLTWVGGMANRGGKVFHWVDGSIFDYSKWQPGQPDLVNEDCLSIGWFKNHNWDNTWCHYKASYLCSHKPGKIEVPKTNCKKGWLLIGSQCVRYFPQNVNYQQAKSICKNMGAQLPTVHNLNENTLIFGLTPQTNFYWLGAHSNGGGHLFQWLDGSKWTYTHWWAGQPDISSQNCMTVGYFKNAFWDNWWCNKPAYLICASPHGHVIGSGNGGGNGNGNGNNNNNNKGSKFIHGKNTAKPYHTQEVKDCDKGYTLFENHCYKLLSGNGNWNDGSRRCGLAGGWMVAVHNKNDADALSEFLKLRVTDVWTGGFKGIHSLKWTWTDNGSFNYRKFDNGLGWCLGYDARKKTLTKSYCSDQKKIVCRVNVIKYQA